MAWLAGYKYRKKIPITGSVGAGTDYQVLLTVYKVTGGDENTEEQTTYDTPRTLYSGFVTRAAQRLTISNRWVAGLSFYISRYGNPSGDVTFTIRDISDNILSSKVWGDAGGVGIIGAWKEVTFDTPVYINEEVRICCEYSGGDSSNYVRVYRAESDEKADECYSYYSSLPQVWVDYDSPTLNWDTAYKYTYQTIEEDDGIVFLNDLCTDFPNDIRFTDDDGVTELDHFLEDSSADPAKFWIEVDDDLDDNQNFYIYFGKAGASSPSNGADTFPFFDDFPGDSIDTDKWEEDTDGASVAGGILTYTSETTAWKRMRSKTEFSKPGAILIKAQVDDAGGSKLIGFETTARNDKVCFYHNPSYPKKAFASKDGSTTEIVNQGEFVFGVYAIFEAKWTTDIATYICDDSEFTDSPIITNVPTVDLKATISAYNDSIFVDWIAVRKYIYTEPVVGTPGSLEDRKGAAAHHYKMMRES